MKFAKRLLMVAGAVALSGLLGVALAPRAVHAVVATLVQIVPGTTTHVGQNESQLVALICSSGQSSCVRENPSGAPSVSPFVVPAGYTLVITDYNWVFRPATCPSPGGFCPGDLLLNLNVFAGGYFSMQAFVLSQPDGSAFALQHFDSGVRVASGVTVTDEAAHSSVGSSTVFGYLVPN